MQHKTIDRRKAGKKTPSVPNENAGREHKVIDRRQTGKKTVTVPTAPAQGKNTGGGDYYSPREYGAQMGAYETRVTAARTAMEEQGKNLRTSQTEVEALWKAAQDAQTAYQNCRGMFKGATAAQYEQQFLTRWTEAAQNYSQRYQQFEQEYEKYKPYEDAYNAALGEYNAYVSSEQEAYGQWKSTIRGAEDIRAEQQELGKRRQELRYRMQRANEYSQDPLTMPAHEAAANEERIRYLQEYLGGLGEREKLLEEELGWSEHFRFEDLRGNADFAQRSQYRSTGTAGELQVDPLTGQTYDAGSYDRTYEYVNRNARAVGAQAMNDVNNEMGHLQTMTDDEIAMYNYLYATQGPEGAAEYLGHLRQELTARQQEGYNALIDETVRSGGVPGAVLASAGSLLLSPFAGLQTAVGQLGSALTGQEIDPNAGYAMSTNTKNALRQSVSKQVEAHAGPVGSFAYQTVMSMGDMLMDAAVGGPGAMALIGTRAFSEGVMDAKGRGLSNGKALTLGAVSGLAEVLTERIGLDELLHLPDGWEDAGFWKGLLRGAAGEAAEEGLTNIVNLAADLAYAGKDSEFMRTVRANMEQQILPDGSIKTGMSREEATKAAVIEALKSVGLDALGGALSGGAFGGYRGWQGKRAADVQQKQEKAPSVSEADSSPIPDGTGEPVETAPVAGSAEVSSAAETVSAQGTQEDVQKTPSRGRGTDPVRPGAGLEELKQQAMNRRNPLISGKLPTAQDEELLRRIRDAGTKTEVTAIDYGVSQEKTQEALRIGEMIGRTIVFDPPGTSYNGFYHRPSGEVHISADTTDILAATVGHELTHSIELTESWQELKRLVAERMAEIGTSWEAATRERKEANAAAGNVLPDQDTVDQEIVAHYVEKHLLTDEQSIRQLVRKDKSVARIILDWLDGLWAKVARTPKSKEREFVRRARETYRQALEEEKAQRNRREAMAVAHKAYAEGRDQEGDAALEAAMSEHPEGWLEPDLPEYEDYSQVPEDYDGPEYDHLIPFSVRKKTDRRGGDDSVRYSVRERGEEEDGGFTKGWYADDEAARAAQMEGYPIINGIQVVPMKTFVLAKDFKKDKAGNMILDKQGNPIQNHNYGLVAGLGSKPGTLKINFHNKHVVNEETGQTLRADGVEIDIADLTPTPGVFQQTDEEFWSLMEQAPEEPGARSYTEEELAELEEMRRRAYMEEDAKGRKEWAPVERAALSGRAAEHLGRVERKLTANVAAAMDVPRQASREFLKPIVQELADEYMKQGTISPEVRDRLFEKAWDQGRVVDQEFYDTYKEVKDHLRSTAVTLSETDRDSRDWNEFRKRAFGTLKIVNEGGTPVDVLWQELQEMAPALFPDDILNPEDQLKHMYDVGSSIRKVEKTLDEHYGSDAAMAKQMTRNDFDAAVADCIRGLWEVKRYADEQRTEAAAVTDEKGSELTEEEITALYTKLKGARRALEKAKAKNLLNRSDRNQVQRLLRHDIQLEQLDPDTDNVRGILAVYEALRAFEDIAEPIRRWNKQRKAKLYAEAEKLVYAAEMAGGIKDKSKGFLYSRETMERNFRDIVKDQASADKLADTYIKPVHQGEAAATRMKNEYRDRVRALNISRKVRKGDTVSEAYAVQFYGEVSDILRLMEESKFRLKQRDGKSYNEWKAELQKLWEENPSLDKAKIENAAREMGKIYEELFTEMNRVRIRNGYEPINHRSGYFPHFQQDGRDGILSQFGKALGIDVEVQALPTSINGMTHTFKPGIRWFGNALERKTFDTAYDAVEGFDRYIEGVASVVHQTDNIQRLRALANQIRYRTGDEGLREQIRKIQERTDLSDEQKDTLIRETASEGKFRLSNFVVELDEYTNLLANKKSRADRNMEQAMGRDMYNIVKGLESRVAANMVAINPGSWLTNFIPITQGWAALDTRNLLKGMMQTIRAVKTDDGMVDMSDFLTNRVGSDALVQTAAQKVSGALSSPMEWIDGFTAGSLVRARYAQNIAQGMSEAGAMSEADEWAAGVMADRSKGAMPTVFHRSNPLTKLLTQFQLEVNNQLSYMFKDIPREKRKKGVLAVAAALLKLALGAWLYNELYEKFLGRRPALDPIDMAFGFVTDWMDPELDLADATVNLGGKIAENTPFIGGLIGGGRVPISSALPDVTNLVKAVGDSDWSAGKKLAAAGKELAKPLTYMVLPFGGGQVKKIWEGLQMIRKDGSYTVDKDGNPLLQYPLYSTNDAVQKALEASQAMIFGKTTIRSGRAWVEGGFKNLSADQTATYQALVNLGVEQADAFELMQELRGAEKAGEQSRAQVQRDILRASGLEGDALGIVYYDLLVDDDSKEKALMEALQKDGADMGAVASCLMEMKDAKESSAKREILLNAGLDGETLAAVYKDLMVDDDSKEKALLESLQKGGADMGRAASCLMKMKDAADSNAKRDILRTSGLTEQQKQDIYRDRISDSYDERIGKFREAGMDMDDFLIAQNEYTRIKDSYEDEGDMATAFARWVNNSGYTAAQKAVIRDSLKYWRQLPANADGYDRAIEAGLSDADAAELVEDLKAVTPLEGEDNKKQYQNWRVAIDNAVNEKNQLMLLKSVGMNDASYAKCEAAWGQGIAPAAYVRAKELESQFNEDGKGSLKNTEWTKLIDSMTTTGIVLAGDNTRFHLTNEQKGFLWQMLTGSKSTKNNPYSVRGGEKWLEIKEAMEEEKEE